MRRKASNKASKLVLISGGAALAWFLDPVSGAQRRRQVVDQLSALTGREPAGGGDPTGGAAPVMAEVPPAPTNGNGDLAQAVEAASGGEKVLRTPADAVDGADRDQSTLR
jgi:hypothetical protein